MKQVLGAIYTFYIGPDPAPHDAFIRTEVMNGLKGFLDVLAAQRRISDYKVICDDTTTFPSHHDLGWLNVLVYWKVPGETTVHVFAVGEPQWVANVTRPTMNVVPV